MKNFNRSFIPPESTDWDKTRKTQLIYKLISISAIIMTFSLVLFCFLVPQNTIRWILILAFYNLTSLGLLQLNQKGYTRLVSYAMLSLCILFILTLSWSAGGIHSIAIQFLPIIVLTAGLLLGWKAGIRTGIIVILTGLVLVLIEYGGILPANSVIHNSVSLWLILSLSVGFLTLLQYLSVVNLEKALLMAKNELNLRTAAEAELQLKENHYRSIFENANDAIFILQDGKIIDCNSKTLQMFGSTLDQFLNLSTDDLSPEFQPDKQRSAEKAIHLLTLTARGTAQRFEWQHRKMDGSLIDVEVSLSKLEVNNDKMILAIVHDITQRISQAEALRVSETKYRELFGATQALNEEYKHVNCNLSESLENLRTMNSHLEEAKKKAEESDRLKTAFLQNMSHEIRTPMNAIIGFSELLFDNFGNKDKLLKYSLIIQRRSIDLLHLINDILDLSRIESGLQTLHQEPCDVNHLFDEFGDMFTMDKRNKDKNDIQLVFRPVLAPYSPIILTDKGKLRQILINLINNAFKFTDHGTIEVGCDFSTAGMTRFYVSDTGLGIPFEKQALIFDRFMQLNNTLDNPQGGTGLGLAIVKGLVEFLGGEISVQSEVNVGSCFSFSISR